MQKYMFIVYLGTWLLKNKLTETLRQIVYANVLL